MSDPRELLAELLEVAARSAPGPWVATSWSPTTVMPARWAADNLPIAERGQFAVIYVGENVTAEHVVSALNGTPRLMAALTAVLDEHTEGPNRGQVSLRRVRRNVALPDRHPHHPSTGRGPGQRGGRRGDSGRLGCGRVSRLSGHLTRSPRNL